MKRFSPLKFVSSLVVFLLLVSLFSYYSADAQSKRTYYVHRTSKLYASASSGNYIRYVPVNAKLSTASKKSSKRYRVTYNGQTGYVYRVNLSARRTTVNRYIAKTSYLYTSRDTSKSRIQKIAVDKSLTTDSNLNSTMYHVNYKGRRGYVYRVNLSTGKTPVTKFVVKTSRIYKNYSHTKRYATTIPTQTQLTTTSPQSNRMFWISYRGIRGYVYASNLGSNQQYYNNTIPSGATGYIAAGGNHGIWSKPYGLYGASDIGKAADYVNVPLSIKQESKVGSTVWIQIAYNGRILGWVHKDIVQDVSPHLSFANVKPDNINNNIYNAPSGKAIANLVPYAQLKLKIDYISNDGQWVHIRKYTAGTSLGWVPVSNLDVENAAGKQGNIINVNYSASITDSEGPVFDDSVNFRGYLNQFQNGNSGFIVTKEKMVGNEEMYNLSQNGQSIGWVRSNTIHVVKPGLTDKDYVFSLIPDNIYNGTGDGLSADTNAKINELGLYNGHMLEIVKQSGDYSFIKYNDWYDKDGNDIDLGWVKTTDLNQLPNHTAQFQNVFSTGGGNQQGLAYNSDKGIYYVGYDTGNGYGKIVPYVKNGYGQYTPDNNHVVEDKFGHACALSYNPYDGMLYEVSSAGPDPVLYTIDPDSMRVTSTVIKDMPYVSMMTVKDKDTLIMLTQASGSDAFSEYSITNKKYTDPHAHKIKNMGVVQGMQYDQSNHKLYYLANNYVAVLDDAYQLLPNDIFHFSIPSGGPAQESEGLTIANEKLTIGFGNHQIFQQK